MAKKKELDNGWVDVDVDKIKFRLHNVNWNVSILKGIDFLRVGGERYDSAYIDTQDSILFIQEGASFHDMIGFLKGFLHIAMFCVGGTKIDDAQTIDKELACNMLALGITELFNQDIIKLNFKKIKDIQFKMYYRTVKVVMTDPLELSEFSSEDKAIPRGVLDFNTGTIYLDDTQSEGINFLDFWHEFCHVCFKIDAGTKNYHNGDIDLALSDTTVAMGLFELLIQDVISFNEKYLKKDNDKK